MPNLLLITGGRHPYEETTPVLTAFLQDAGHDVAVSEHAEELASDLSGYDAIVLNTLRQPLTDNDLNNNQRDGLMGYVWTGGGLVSLHISAASCPDWEHMKPMTGGGWILNESWHPPFGWFKVNISNSDHPLANGVKVTHPGVSFVYKNVTNRTHSWCCEKHHLVHCAYLRYETSCYTSSKVITMLLCVDGPI